MSKKFEDWGIRMRKGDSYLALWHNLETIRLEQGDEKALPPERSEFYDVSITTRCNAVCPFCYVSAGRGGLDAPDIVGTWKKWMATFPDDIPTTFDPGPVEKGEGLDELQLRLLLRLSKGKVTLTEKPFQIAIGAQGEGTLHPDFPKFLQAVHDSNVVPNYTTNGILLSDKDKARELLEATSEFCGGVAVSFGNKEIRKQAMKAIDNLLAYGDCKVVIHHIISDKNSVNEFLELQKSYGNTLHYHVLLPLMKHGRSSEEMNMATYDYLCERVKELGITNVAYGANFAPFMQARPGSVSVWEYPKEIYSKNLIMSENSTLIFTPSSFNLEPCKVLKL